jgi:hypothetical protein
MTLTLKAERMADGDRQGVGLTVWGSAGVGPLIVCPQEPTWSKKSRTNHISGVTCSPFGLGTKNRRATVPLRKLQT